MNKIDVTVTKKKAQTLLKLFEVLFFLYVF